MFTILPAKQSICVYNNMYEIKFREKHVTHLKIVNVFNNTLVKYKSKLSFTFMFSCKYNIKYPASFGRHMSTFFVFNLNIFLNENF